MTTTQSSVESQPTHEAELRRLLVDVNDTRRELAAPAPTLHGAFLATAGDRSDDVCVVAPEGRLTYGEMAARIRRLAKVLSGCGAGPGSLIGMCLRPSPELIVSAFAIMATGAAFVPLDPRSPTARRERMLAMSECTLVVTDTRVRAGTGLLEDEGPTVILLDQLDEVRPGSVDRSGQEFGVDPEERCYVMFTSGSTGDPKGIQIRHRGIVNNIADLMARYRIGQGDSVLALSSPAFDMSVMEMLGIPAFGGAVVIPSEDAAASPGAWVDLIERESVTVWNSAPALAELLLDEVDRDGGDLASLRVAMLGGDWIPVGMPDRFRTYSPTMTISALGGATEASIHSCVYDVGRVDPAWASIPYGAPLANQRMYILDENDEPLPVGHAGELCLAGEGLARGYLGNVDNQRFTTWSHPLVGEERIYRSGDLARWRPDGNAELIGRIDLQLKVHGVRIEARAVERAIGRHPLVREAVVVVTGAQEAQRRLTAFVTASAEGGPSLTELREFLEPSLVPEQIPTALHVLDAFPLNPNGKVDRLALTNWNRRQAGAGSDVVAEPDADRGGTGDAAERVRAVWQQVLGVTDIHGGSNFFELGGDSFTAMLALDQIDPRLRLADLFSEPTVDGLVAHLEARDGGS